MAGTLWQHVDVNVEVTLWPGRCGSRATSKLMSRCDLCRCVSGRRTVGH